MATLLAIGFILLSVVGLLALALQHLALRRHVREPVARANERPPISILKPLCGLDDGLEEHLARFAAGLDYPDYEVLLGVRSTDDAAYPLARAAAMAFPDRVRVILQNGEPGANPKVNQLITLAAAARHDLIVVSDSNVSVPSDYLEEIAMRFEADPRVALVTHAIVGDGEERLGSLLDNLHLTCQVGPGLVAAKRVANKDIVVGKSMALRRSALDALGGFTAVKDVLAEDYVLGRMVVERGWRVAHARRPITNVSCRRGVREFYARYQRWSVIHRQAVGPLAYCGEALLNPIFLALAAVPFAPSATTAFIVGAITMAKIAVDALTARSFGRSFGMRLAAVPLKDVIVGAAWAQGLVRRRVDWRGNRLVVLRGTQLEAA
jgi:ceramide glucosyltransferase